jgi:cobalt-zinc-cadmium efflux system outer membrane protein
MADVTARTATTSAELQNIGQADQPDRLSAEIEAEHALLGVSMARNAQDRVWREIAALVNLPSAAPQRLEGDLEAVPAVVAEAALQRILAESPEIRAAEAFAARNGVLVQRAHAENVPDLQLRGGLHYNRELLELTGGRVAPVGKQGSFEAGIQIPIFNRNQGGIAAAEAEAAMAGREVDRVRLALRQRFAAEFRQYQDSVASLTRYRETLIPKAREAFDMYTANFRQMSAAYPKILASQRDLVQLQDEYLGALLGAWESAIEIDGLLAGEMR